MSEMLDLVAAAIDDHMSFNATYTALELATVALGISERCERWQPIATAPRDGTKFLAGRFVKKGSHNNLMAVDRWHARERGDDWDGPGKFNTHYWPATHWQPLPAPPLPTEAPTASPPSPAADHSGVAGLGESGT